MSSLHLLLSCRPLLQSLKTVWGGGAAISWRLVSWLGVGSTLVDFLYRSVPLCSYSLLLISNKFCNWEEQCGNVTLPHWRGGGGGEQCGKVTLPHYSPTPPVQRGRVIGGERRGPSQRGRSQRGIVRGGRVRGVDAEWADCFPPPPLP